MIERGSKAKSKRACCASLAVEKGYLSPVTVATDSSSSRRSHGLPCIMVPSRPPGVGKLKVGGVASNRAKLQSCSCLARAVARHNHTSTICGSSLGGLFNWIKPEYRLRKTFRTSLSDLELIDSLLGP